MGFWEKTLTGLIGPEGVDFQNKIMERNALQRQQAEEQATRNAFARQMNPQYRDITVPGSPGIPASTMKFGGPLSSGLALNIPETPGTLSRTEREKVPFIPKTYAEALGYQQATQIQQQMAVPAFNQLQSLLPLAYQNSDDGIRESMQKLMDRTYKETGSEDARWWADSLKTMNFKEGGMTGTGVMDDKWRQVLMTEAKTPERQAMIQSIPNDSWINVDTTKGKFSVTHDKSAAAKNIVRSVKRPDGKYYDVMFDNAGNEVAVLGESKSGSGTMAQYQLSDKESSILATAVERGLVNPDKLNRFNAKMYAQIFSIAPNLNFVSGVADANAVKKLRERTSMLRGFEENALKKMAVVKERYQALGREDTAYLLNRLSNEWATRLTGSEPEVRYMSALKEYLLEYAKVATGSTTNQAASDSAREMVASLLPAASKSDTFYGVLEDQVKMMSATTEGMESTIAEIQSRSKTNVPSGVRSPTNTPANARFPDVQADVINEIQSRNYPDTFDQKNPSSGVTYRVKKEANGDYSATPLDAPPGGLSKLIIPKLKIASFKTPSKTPPRKIVQEMPDPKLMTGKFLTGTGKEKGKYWKSDGTRWVPTDKYGKPLGGR